MANNKSYTPNQVSLSSRLLRTAGAIILIAHGAIGIFRDDVIIPTKRSILHLHGISGWITALSMICAALVLFAVVVDHFDRRDNEAAYKQFGRWMSRAGWVLMGLGMGLHAAGVRYPGPSNTTTIGIVGGVFIFICAAAIGFANEKAVERAASLPVPVPPPKTSGALTFRFDRSFSGLLLMVVGTLVFLAGLPGLIQFLLIQYVVAALAVIMTVAGWMIFSTQRNKESVNGDVSTAKARNWRPIRIGVLLVVGLGAIWFTKASQWGKWLDEDEEERRRAPEWNYHFDDFTSGISQADIQKYLSAEGFRMRCYGNLGPNERLVLDDISVCWTIARSAYGIPSRMIVFSFGTKGLQAIRQDFPKEQWGAVRNWLRYQGDADAGSFGRDQQGSKVVGRRAMTGLLLTSEPGIAGWTMLLWRGREHVLADCQIQQESDPQWQLLCRDWPAPPSPSNFVLRHRPPVQSPADATPNSSPVTQSQS